jgi:hypothetical protein
VLVCLVQSEAKLLFEFGEVVTIGVGMDQTLFRPAPDLFLRVQGGRIGGEEDQFQPAQPLYLLEQLRVAVVGPVVLHDAKTGAVGIGLAELAIVAAQFGNGDAGRHAVDDVPLDCLQGGRYPDHAVAAVAPAKLGLAAAPFGPQPALRGLAIEAGLVQVEQLQRLRVLPGLFEEPGDVEFFLT